MPGEQDQPQAGSSLAGVDRQDSEVNWPWAPGGVRPEAGAPGPRSWIQKVLEQVTDSPLQWLTPSEVDPVAVLAVQRYLLEEEPGDIIRKRSRYRYDVTVSDGVYQEKCFLHPRLNFLVSKNILRVGIKMRIFRVSCLYNEKRLGQGILCIDNVDCVETLDTISLATPFRNSAHQEIPERPLRGGKSHYLALWNNEDPYGDIWLTNKQPEEYNFNNTRIISLAHLEMIWTKRTNYPALLVRIMHKSRLRYYGKPDKKMIEPYQTFLEVADNSGTVSVIMWNALCPEWYKCLQVGLVLLLQDYSVKKSFPFRLQPLPVDPQIKQISTMEVCLNLRDPPTNINIIPEGQVKPEWRLPKLNHRFITRSELDDMPEKQICDVVGVLVFVGRVQRLKKRGHRGQPYANDTKVKSFIHWIKTKTDSGEMKNTVIGGYYPYPPVPETFSKYSTSVKVQSLLTAISEVRKEIENLQYREQKRIAIQGIITIIKYMPRSSATGSSSASERVRNVNQPSTSQTAIKESQSQELDGKQNQDDGSVSCQTTCTSLSPPKKKRILQGPFAKLVPVPQPETSAQTRENIPDTPSIFQRRESASTGIKWKARKTLTHIWESQLWREKKFGLREHLCYRFVYPESIPRKFNFEHKNFLIQQYNCQPAKYKAPEGRPPQLSDFKSAQSLGHFEVTILGLNHERAIDVAFLPLYCPEDIRTSQIDTLLACMNYSCVYPQAVTDSERMPGPRALAGDIIKAVTKLDRVHVICILDICNLGNNKVEVCLHKIYRPDNR
uniref:RPA1 related single stranded DNA binding protein, X-linked n=1 Tax=Myotis myotis TaxID=51298 RepID=A0A7J7YFI9_MYOMY|nr:RPA1 related single stranded DNA binding protein, X-linked [Myotis myotis]